MRFSVAVIVALVFLSIPISRPSIASDPIASDPIASDPIAYDPIASDSILIGGQPTLSQLAQRYEAEVAAMQKIVKRTRGVDRSDERLIERFDDEVGRLRLAARNPRHFNRLANQWNRVETLSGQIESTLFSKYTPNRDWLGQWDRVIVAELMFVDAFVLEVENPDHVNSVRRLDRPSARRASYLEPRSPSSNQSLAVPAGR